jgi:hypothetical protein
MNEGDNMKKRNVVLTLGRSIVLKLVLTFALTAAALAQGPTPPTGAPQIPAQGNGSRLYLPSILKSPSGPAGLKGAALPYQEMVCGDVAALDARWFYDWDYKNPCPASQAEFVPMTWSVRTLPQADQLPKGEWLLGPNEPNYAGQAVASPEEVVVAWPTLEATGRKLVSPAVSACEDPKDANCLNPLWLEQFMASCARCRVDAIALHWYGCDVNALAAYLDKRAHQFNKPLWLTEWSCPDWAGNPVVFMQRALPVVQARVERYAWFATRTKGWPYLDPLITGDNLTSLGSVYREAAPGSVP